MDRHQAYRKRFSPYLNMAPAYTCCTGSGDDVHCCDAFHGFKCTWRALKHAPVQPACQSTVYCCCSGTLVAKMMHSTSLHWLTTLASGYVHWYKGYSAVSCFGSSSAADRDCTKQRMFIADTLCLLAHGCYPCKP